MPRSKDAAWNEVLASDGPGALAIGRNVDRILNAVRTHLGMDVAFISEFSGRQRTFRHVVGALEPMPLQAGDSMPLEEGYCLRVVEGRIPQLIPDTRAVPLLAEIPDTAALPIGAHLSVPIKLSDGRIFGTFCCFSLRPNLSLSERDMQMMRAFAELLAYQIDGDLDALRVHEEKVERINAVLEMGQPSIAYQPIYRLSDDRIIGVECLSRFDLNPPRPPDVWFQEAREIGLGVRLELNAMLTAMDGLRHLLGGFYVSLNVSPQTIISGQVAGYLDALPLDRVVLELTEHAHVEDYAALREQLTPLRRQGVRVAVDDAGAGYASMRHVLAISPDIIKLDMTLTRSIDSDSPRRALAAALIAFARQTHTEIVAEGVETAEELAALKALGVEHAQGYYLSRPLALTDLSSLLNPGENRLH